MTEKSACLAAQSSIKNYYNKVGYVAAKIPSLVKAEEHAKCCEACREFLKKKKKRGHR